jgi:hypothetical protein
MGERSLRMQSTSEGSTCERIAQTRVVTLPAYATLFPGVRSRLPSCAMCFHNAVAMAEGAAARRSSVATRW